MAKPIFRHPLFLRDSTGTTPTNPPFPPGRAVATTEPGRAVAIRLLRDVVEELIVAGVLSFGDGMAIQRAIAAVEAK
jgi:hypothetical protein